MHKKYGCVTSCHKTCHLAEQLACLNSHPLKFSILTLTSVNASATFNALGIPTALLVLLYTQVQKVRNISQILSNKASPCI